MSLEVKAVGINQSSETVTAIERVANAIAQGYEFVGVAPLRDTCIVFLKKDI